jgi:Arc/MetJ family transcription regulator
MADQLTAAARQVRLDRKDSVVHELVRRWVDWQVGASYKTRCDHVLTKAEGAILTTREATCGPCLRGGW